MEPESEEIKQENNIDKYASRPHILKDMCLADFVSLTDIIYSNNKQIQSDDELSINEDSSDEDNPQTKLKIKTSNHYTHSSQLNLEINEY